MINIDENWLGEDEGDFSLPTPELECPSDGTDSFGRCLGQCRECDSHLLRSGRETTYCPTCDVCPECGEPQADGNYHAPGCPVLAETEESEDEDA
jgi:hypothetical protein